MSNDRLFLFCRPCNVSMMIGKYWPGRLAVGDPSTAMKFIEEHIVHGEDPLVGLSSGPCVSLESERSLPKGTDHE